MFRWLLLIPLLAACKGGEAEGPCFDLCDQLVETCAYAAFPTYESCLQGCMYNFEQGAQIVRQSECVTAAECDTFQILECEHAYGI